MRVLEVGAGTGRDSLRMFERGARACILDYSEESLRLVRSRLATDKITCLLADALDTPLQDDAFDIVFHQGLLEHFPTPYPLLRENHRVLKTGGLLVVDVPQTFHFYTIVKHALMFLGIWFGGWERQFTIDSLSRLLENTGFEPVHVYADWSRPGIAYKILRMILQKFRIALPMYPRYLGALTEKFYALQKRLRRKRLFMYTALSIGIIARKV
jgi:ubiquinone/menaquinone biosynthesis C-methylase UbiE